MTIPTAVATGGAGSSAPDDDRVRPRPIAIGAGVIAALVVFVAYLNVEVPGRAVRLFGGAAGGVARYGGVELRWVPPAGLDLAQLQDKFAHHDLGAELRRDGDAIHVAIPRVTQAQAPEVVMLVENGALEFHEVVEGADLKWFVDHGLAFDQIRGEEREPAFDVDQWRPEDGGKQHTDFFLRAHSRQLLEAAFAEAEQGGWQPPPHTVIGYERIIPLPGAKERREVWRTYVLRDEVSLDGMAIAHAEGSYDPNTNRPVVMVEFDRAGAEAFGELTSRITGHKLAIVVGGVVRSAPVINSPIRGGRAQITMSGSDLQHMEHERDVLVATLRSGTLPIGGHVLDWKFVASTNGISEQLARIGVAVGGGLAVALVAFLLVALTRPQRRRVDPVAGTGKRWRRVLWTLGSRSRASSASA